jgi:multidrug resistance efflux pump
MKNKWCVIPFLLVLALIGMTGCSVFGESPEPTPVPTPVQDPGVITEGNLVPEEEITLSFAIPGQVSEVLVSEGETVVEGAVLARLGDTESIQAEIAAAELAVLDAQQALTDLQDNSDLAAAQAQVSVVEARQALVDAEKAWDAVDTDDFQDELDDARIEVNDAEDDLEAAEEELEEVDDLDEDNPIRQDAEDDLEDARQAYDEARWALEVLENQYDLAAARLETAQAVLEDAEQKAEVTHDGAVDPDDLALAEANLAQAEARLAAAEAVLEDAVLTAPFSGTVVHVDLLVGAETRPGQPAIVLADFSSWYVETNDLTENEVVRIKEGEAVTVVFDSLPEMTFSGEVESISDYYQERFGDITYLVRIRLEEADGRLRWGMTAEVRFDE